MKWYKKQMDKILAEQGKTATEEESDLKKNTLARSFDERKKIAPKNTFVNPVVARNLNRPKTDSK